jgi:pimeloyl-ACP methyl ester carboxylesterase
MSINDRTIEAHDGTRIAYSVVGDGPALVLTNGLTTTTSFWSRLRPMWSKRYTVVTWDYPGHGRSEPTRTPAGASIEAQPQTIRRIMDALGVEQATHVGFSVGCQVILEMARQFPERCRALVALLGTSEHAISSTGLWLPAPIVSTLFHKTPEAVFAPGFRVLAKFANTNFGLSLGRKLRLVGSASESAMRGVTEHFLALDPDTMRVMAQSAERHSAFDVLSTLELPLLIVAGDKDPFAPVERVGLRMHEAAPGSELVRLAEGTHTAMLDHAEDIYEAVERFLARKRAQAAE